MKNNINILYTGKLKMKKCFSVFALALSLAAGAQTTTENYVYSKVTLSENGSKKSETIQYFDGLGRPKQTIQVKSTPLGQDIVMPVTYDQLGRQTRSILPVPMPTSNLGIQNVSEATANAYYGVPNAYSEQKLEASPLARVLETASPGAEWAMNSGHTRKAAYEINKNSDKVKKFSFTNSWVSTIAVSSVPTVSFYNEKVLVKTSGTDEDGNKTIEFTNGLGQTVLVRKVITATENADTYYLYNDYGQLIYVISPKAEAQITSNNNVVTQQILDDLCYQYKYDNKGRLAEKKIPGKGWEYMVYNKADRLILTQDTVLKEKGQWLFTKYDQFGRVVYTGITNNAASRASMQNSANVNTNLYETRTAAAGLTINSMPVYYTNLSTPTGVTQILSVNYYDTYPEYSFNPAFPSTIFGKPVLTDNLTGNLSTRALPVMSLVKNIEDDSWTKSYSYYDTKGRPVGGYSINHLGGYTRTESELDFAGVPLQVKTYHKRLNTDMERVITEVFTYDNQNRLLTHTHQVDSNTPEILNQNKYNELSQLQSKKVGGTSAASPLQVVDYTYNIRGWITKINDPANLNGKLFGYEIKYQNPVYTNIAAGKFNGNIAEIDWKNSSEDVLKRYSYSYDVLNRLKDAIYTEPNATNPYNNNYNENLTYDLNGNIATLKRNAFPVSGNTSTLVDDLTYQYTGNRLTKVTENALNDTGYEGGNNPITYDLNGNMKDMLDKGIQSIGYNYLNLSDNYTIQQTVPLGGTFSSTINYLYRADGSKLRKTFSTTPLRGSTSTTVTDYLDGFQYSYSEGGGICITCRTENAYEQQAYKGISGIILPGEGIWKLDFVPTAEGVYSFTENRYIYQYRDHLGNTRISFAKNSEGALEVTDTNNYYPFGLNHISGMFSTSGFGSYYSYKYNGKELQETGMFDYGARMYMPDLGRWGVIDPLAEASRRFTPYHYGNNNPIRFIDPDGRLTVDNLQGGYSTGSAVADFMYRTGLSSDERNMPLFYRNEGGAMIRTEALGNEGQGGGSGPTPRSSTGPGVIERFISWLFGGKKKVVRLEVGQVERVQQTALFGLIRNANVNANGESPLEQYRTWRDNPSYHAGESWLDRFARNVNSSHMEILQDEGSGGGLMFGGYGKTIAAAEEVSMTSKIAAEAEANGILSTQRGINPAKVAEYFEQMSNGTYKPTGGAGYIYEGKYILTDGNHRMNAAIQHGIESGNFKYVEEIINKGNFIRRNPLIDNYKVYKLPVK
ncbi:RHS repeat-associated core domain-containing protein [Chryseobacterium rhizoplanae]|uniref:RHS repeat-associated core domain-containing protein n=1 Tax=Chryseobacterium rhizoplanae TaxID=1609531 RepID=A0A521BKK6_9FLAO|nr:DUF6443 domain-containing protein [Chryseobacterium rhizoplanae]SMO47361.1 RHS repeat-associated core domain-containing protein [Chryseobacterium rhizoplanae]